MMQLTTASSIHNRGTFQTANTALTSGGMGKDRQSGGETYMPFQQGDEVRFSPAQQYASEAQSQGGMSLLTDYIFNIDTRVIMSLIAALLFSTVLQALVHSIALTVLLGLVFFVIWHIMSYFSLSRVLSNVQHGPRQNRYSHHQVPATF